MRVIIVGTSRQRRDLRAVLDSPPDIVAEFPSVADARRSGISADAILSSAGTDLENEVAVDVEPLTAREIEVLELLAEALPNKSIASRLGISDQTVKFHLASIAGKLGAVNRTDAVRKAVRRGLVAL